MRKVMIKNEKLKSLDIYSSYVIDFSSSIEMKCTIRSSSFDKVIPVDEASRYFEKNESTSSIMIRFLVIW